MMIDVDIQKLFFYPICNKQEIERIFDVRNARDYLLKLRADTIVDHMRLFRVYRNKALMNEKKWSLEKSFNSSHFKSFLRYLPEKIKAECLETTFGNMFSNDPNGSIFQTEFGPIITISDSLQFFMKFSHLALLVFKRDVPTHVRINALRIAIRVMLKTEALDFFMDPRGTVPEDIAYAIQTPIPRQLEFIAGHEFAHYVLGHISDTKVISKPIYFAISPRDKDYMPIKVYNQSQKEEYEADIQAILLPRYSPRLRGKVFEAALLWFGCLELYETARNTMFPQSPWSYRSHPTARERFDNILTNIPTPPDIDITSWKRFLESTHEFREFLIDDISRNIELYENYGSVYLDKPDTEWRGPRLIDRVDYY